MGGMIIFAHNPDVSTTLDMTNGAMSFRPKPRMGRSGEIWLRTAIIYCSLADLSRLAATHLELKIQSVFSSTFSFSLSEFQPILS